MQVVFRCGTPQLVDPDKTVTPVCAHCGTTVIGRTVGARSPRFTGVASGPHCETRRMEPIGVSLVTTVPLALKPEMPAEKTRTH